MKRPLIFNIIFIISYFAVSVFTHNENSDVIKLNEDNWRIVLESEWMIEFYAPWCPACKTLTPIWEDFAEWSDNVGIRVGQIDVTISPALSGRFFVTALPTIFHVKNGEFRQYRGSRELKPLVEFIKEKKWQSVESISTWKQPNSIHMSLIAYFFKLSHGLKDFNNMLLTEYGLPPWGSYAIFAIGTIILGALLGLFLVCVIDAIYPPKYGQRQSFSDVKLTKVKDEYASIGDADLVDENEVIGNENKEDNVEEVKEDDIVDDLNENIVENSIDHEEINKVGDDSSEGEKYSNSDSDNEVIGDATKIDVDVKSSDNTTTTETTTTTTTAAAATAATTADDIKKEIYIKDDIKDEPAVAAAQGDNTKKNSAQEIRKRKTRKD